MKEYLECIVKLQYGVEVGDRKELVRCKDCVHWDEGHTEECCNIDSICFHNGVCKPDWFCADGEKADKK